MPVYVPLDVAVSLRGWLKQLHVTEIAMESTGVYWWPAWNVLEGHGFQLLLVNPAQVKALQGIKSDKRDAKRIADFLQDGRLDASFVPPPEIWHLRQLVRHRLNLLRLQRTEVHNQIRDLFEMASLKLSSVASDLLGVSGRRIIEAMIAGEESPELLSCRVRGRLQKKKKLAQESLKGYFTDFHRQMLEMNYGHYEFISKQIQELEREITRRTKPYSKGDRAVDDDSGSRTDGGLAPDRGVGRRYVRTRLGPSRVCSACRVTASGLRFSSRPSLVESPGAPAAGCAGLEAAQGQAAPGARAVEPAHGQEASGVRQVDYAHGRAVVSGVSAVHPAHGPVASGVREVDSAHGRVAPDALAAAAALAPAASGELAVEFAHALAAPGVPAVEVAGAAVVEVAHGQAALAGAVVEPAREPAASGGLAAAAALVLGAPDVLASAAAVAPEASPGSLAVEPAR